MDTRSALFSGACYTRTGLHLRCTPVVVYGCREGQTQSLVFGVRGHVVVHAYPLMRRDSRDDVAYYDSQTHVRVPQMPWVICIHCIVTIHQDPRNIYYKYF